ncbi:MAG: M48 family metallopeptidase [Cyanobacteria bacterium SID2]|nr:M48 family metallopeptidase [Cyanobacteria bacterium SID2]MBP0002398.1 M48 family metallopeptidase [Cyanobacteria bacterium SBC]
MLPRSTISLFLTALTASACTLTLHRPAAAQTKRPLTTIEAIESSQTPFDRAESELSESYYALYRIVERMARANDLDGHPWRVQILPEYVINAYSTEANLIGIQRGLLDQFPGDPSVVACIVGHEMAHHINRDAAILDARYAEGRAEIDALGDEIDNKERLELIEELSDRMQQLSRERELEADRFGYQAAVRAGFEAEGCLRGLNLLSRLEGSLRDSGSHPAVTTRIEAIETLIADEETNAAWIENGRRRLATTEPLSYKWSEEDEQLRIDSERGGSLLTWFEE